uniref:Uncharacterized protein n=1 Tax=Brugia timori TaxID=42155 RepID=A0A0R3RAS5_9BILA
LYTDLVDCPSASKHYPAIGTIKICFDPTWCSGDRLTTVLCTPTFYERYSNSTHSSKSINSFKTLRN